MSLGSITLVSALVYVFVVPAAGIIIALLFFDLRIREERVQTSPAIARLERERRVESASDAGNEPRAAGRVAQRYKPGVHSRRQSLSLRYVLRGPARDA